MLKSVAYEAMNPGGIPQPFSRWTRDVGRRCLARFDAITVGMNLDYGDEFEIAFSELLRTILSNRFGVCRGYAFDKSSFAGDDIIVYDAHASPTLRGLGAELALKEFVPVQAVVAYVEAKHRLFLTDFDGGEPTKHAGQTLRRACEQTTKVKKLVRDRVPLAQLDGVLFPVEPQTDSGWPKRRNPLLTMVVARSFVHKGTESPGVCALKQLFALKGAGLSTPDIIVAGKLLLLPVDLEGRIPNAARTDIVYPRPILCSSTELVAVELDDDEAAFGAALALLSWGAGWIRVGPLPWSELIQQGAAGGFQSSSATVPLTGDD